MAIPTKRRPISFVAYCEESLLFNRMLIYSMKGGSHFEVCGELTMRREEFLNFRLLVEGERFIFLPMEDAPKP